MRPPIHLPAPSHPGCAAAQGGWGSPTAGHGGAFYSLTATLSADKQQLTGGMVYRPSPAGPTVPWVSDGTWHATKGAPPDLNFTCVPPAPLPWAGCEALPKSWKPPNATNTTRPLIWPLPKVYSNGSSTLRVVPSPAFFKLSGDSKLLAAAFERYAALTFPHATASSDSDAAAGAVSSLRVSVGSLAEDFPQLNDNESYTLAISAAGEATLAAPTVFGALHGLETFSQLVRFAFIGGAYTLRWAPWRIEDEPRFPHRGLSESSNGRPPATQSSDADRYWQQWWTRRGTSSRWPR